MFFSSRPQSTKGEIKLSVGRFCYSLVTDSLCLTNFLCKYYDGFINAQQKADVTIKLHLKTQLTERGQIFTDLPERYIPYLSYGSDMLEAYSIEDGKTFSVVMTGSILNGINIRLLDKLFCQIYYTLLSQNDLSYIVHGAAIEHNSKGYLFSGRPGCGKSTIASLSCNGDIVLNDEIVILDEIDKCFYVRGTPFAGNSLQRRNGTALLCAIFLLKHGQKNFLRPLRKIEFINMIIKEIGLPRPNLISRIKPTYSNAVDFCERVFDSIPVYELSFRPERGVWKVIDEVT